MADILIRNLTESDLNSLAELYKLFWNEDSNIEKMKDKFSSLKQNENYIFLCAEMDKRVVGSIMGVICDELYGNCKPFLVMEDLVVNKYYRKQKIGSMLLKELEEIGVKKGCSQIIFITENNRQEAISFYEKMGYSSLRHTGFKKKLT